MILPTTILASPGFPAGSRSSFSPIACSTAVFTSDETSLSLVWEENLGIQHLHGDNGNQTFSDVVTTGGGLGLFAVASLSMRSCSASGQRGTEPGYHHPAAECCW